MMESMNHGVIINENAKLKTRVLYSFVKRGQRRSHFEEFKIFFYIFKNFVEGNLC